MLVIHLAFSLLALAAILAILLLPKGRGAHRWLGRLAAAALALSALSSFGIQARGHLSWLHVLSVVTLVNLAWAVWAIRRGRVAVHRRAMLAGATPQTAPGVAGPGGMTMTPPAAPPAQGGGWSIRPVR